MWVTVGEGSSRLEVLWGLPALSLVDMLHATGGGFSLVDMLHATGGGFSS
jgi:hypothetical protein